MIDKNKVIQDLYSFTHDEAGKTAACNYMFDDFPIIERHFDIVDEILDELDLTKINSQLLYNIVWFASNYINQLKNYRRYYKKVVAEAARRGYSEKKIVDLFEKLEDGGNFLYNPTVKYKSPSEKDQERLDNKISWAKEFGDKELLEYLTYYRDRCRLDEKDHEKYNKMRHLLGDKEIEKRTVIALRALADKIESNDGPHFIVDVVLPVVPIFGKQDSEDDHHSAYIKVFVAAYPMGG